MHGKVKRLRERGQRLSDRDFVLQVKDPNSQVGDSLFPRLYEARLTTMHGDKMLFKGEERPQGDAGPALVQEWSVVVE
jgi:hypothetical protein